MLDIAATSRPTTGAKESQIDQQVMQGDSLLERLETLTAALAGRLELVTRPLPVGPAGQDTPQPQLVPLANLMRNRNDRLAKCVNALERLHEGLEL